MDQWPVLLERFLRNECTERENKIVYHAFRDGLIEDEFRQAIDSFMNDPETLIYIDRMNPVPDDVLKTIRSRLNIQEEKPADRKRRGIPEWVKIAAAVIITLLVSWLVFHTKTTQEEPATAMNTIRVPAGQTVNLTLADGTNIWLNARSILKYPGIFTGSRREVILDGEGFFDVAHNLKQPFVVHAGGYNILALGTQFDVEAYPQSNNFSASLLEGSIQVTSAEDSAQTIVLQPNSMMRLHEDRLVVEDITDFSHYRWREGLICFNDMPFNDLMAKFERCYGIKIVIQNNRVKNYKPTGKFRQSDGIDYALRVLQRNIRFSFERDEENYVIYIK
jgi:ferric-dicitrate binding protein FerR (iron transport regulator)